MSEVLKLCTAFLVTVTLNLLSDNKLLHHREKDVAAVDVNMGCPKEYSTKVSPVASH